MVTKVAVNLEMQATGLKSATDQASKLNSELASAQGNAVRTSKALESAKKASQPVGAEFTEYGRSRAGREGGTGASARDFANQAQGLGGLVRLYATYAANVFALSAAFNALSAAMDTTNMIQGLNQLGAASGTALGNLSKQLADTTDGAVSLREAMEATVKASSSGMSNKDILRMGEAAQKASLALGVNMSDALSRISRGITKLEPELLDELGIFVRVDDAAAEYAKSVGKAASELTGFERRMAFANATLEQAEKKFGAIDIESNPYTQLLAEMKNFAQATGEVLNVALVPLVKLLSSSPLALTTVIGGLVAMVLKQAVPAFGQLRESLKESAQQAANEAKRRAEEAVSVRAEQAAKIRELAEAEAISQVDAVDRAEQRLQKISKDSVDKRTSVWAGLKKTQDDGILALSDKDFAAMDASVAKMAQNDAAKAASHKFVVDQLKASYAAELKYQEVVNKTTADLTKYKESGLAIVAAKRADAIATQKQITSNAAYNGSVNGLRFAFANMRAELSASDNLTRFQKTTTAVVGGFSAVAGKIGTAISAFSGWLAVIGTLVAAFGILDSWLDKASKSVSEFNSATESLTSSVDTLNDTIDAIYRKSPGEIFSTDSLTAQAKAVLEVANSIEVLGVKFSKANKEVSKSAWSKSKDWVYDLFGAGLQDNFEEALASSISGAIENLDGGPLQADLKTKLSTLLKVDDLTDSEAVAKSLKGITETSPLFSQLQKILKSTGIDLSNTASKASDFKEALKKAGESYKAFTKQFENKDQLVTFSLDSISALTELDKVLSGPIEGSMDALSEALDKLSSTPIFDPEAIQALSGYRAELEALQARAGEYKTASKDLYDQEKAQIEKLAQLQKDKAIELSATRPSNVRIDSINTQISDANAVLTETRRNIVLVNNLQNKAITEASKIGQKAASYIPAGISNAVGLVQKAIEASFAKGSTMFMQEVYSKFADIPELAGKLSDLKQQEIASQQSYVKATFELTKQLRINAANEEVTRASQTRERAKANLDRDPGNKEYKAALDQAEAALTRAENKLKAMEQIAKDPRGGLNTIGSSLASSLGTAATEVASFASELSGFQKQLSDLGQQIKIEQLNKQVAVIQAEKKTVQQTYQVEEDRLASRIQALELQKQEGRISEFAYLSQSAVLEKEKIRNKYLREMVGLVDDYRSEMVYISNLPQKDKEVAAARLSIKVSTAAEKLLREEALEVNKVDLRTYLEKLKIQKETNDLIVDSTNRMMAAQEQMRVSNENSGLEQMRAEFELQKQKGMLTENEINRLETILQIEAERIRLMQTLRQKAVEYEKEMNRLANESAKLGGPENAAKREQIENEIELRKEVYDQEVQNETKLSTLRVDNLKKLGEANNNKRLKSGIADAIATALFEGGEKGKESLRETIEAELREPFTILVNGIINDLFGLGGTGPGGMGSISNMLNFADNMTKVVDKFQTFGATMEGSIIKAGDYLATSSNDFLAASGDWMTQNAGTLKAVGQYAVGAYGGITVGRAISNGYSAWGKSGNAAVNTGTAVGGVVGASSATMGAMYGSWAGPIGMIIGGAIGGLVNVAFGRKLKEQGVKAIMQGGEVSSVQNYEFQKGGWFKSDKTKTSNADSATIKEISTAFEDIQMRAAGFVRGLGLSSAAIDNFSGELKVNLKGVKSAEEANQRYNESLNKLYVDMIKSTPGFEEFRRKGESVEIALERMSQQAQQLAEASGYSAQNMSNMIRDGMLGRISGDELGTMIGDYLLDSIYNALAQGFADQITSSITSLIITPIMTSVITGGSLAQVVNATTIAAVRQQATDTINAFKALLADPGIQALFGEIMSLGNDLGKILNSATSSIKTKTSSMKKASVKVADSVNKAADERLSLERELLNLLGEKNRLRELELKELDASNRALKRQIWAIEDSKEAVEKAMATLERSIESRRKQLEEELDLATEVRDRAKEIFETLKDNIDELLGANTKNMRVDEARKLIADATSTGILPDAEKLSDAIGVLRDKIDNKQYGSRTEQKRDSLRLANELKLLQGVVEPQMTEAEKQIKALEEQLERLDTQLELSKKQVDALFGIDNTTYEVALAVDRLNTAMTGYQSELNKGRKEVGVPEKRILPPDLMKPPGERTWTAEGYWKNNSDIRSMFAVKSQELISQYGSRDAYLQWHYENFGQAEGRKFKNGGSYLGGLAMVGENGPELINFREPGMVYTAAQTRNLLDTNGMSEEEVALLRELVTEIKMMRYETQATAMHTNKTYRILDRVTKSGQAVQTQEVPPTP